MKVKALLEARNLRKCYGGKTVINGVSLSLQPGEIIGLLGPNGAGKTSTFYLLVGLAKPDSGEVCLNGERITHMPMYQRARKGIAYLPQEPSVFRKLTVAQNIKAILETFPMSREEREEKTESLLVELGVHHLRNVKAYSLSGGERRRVEIGRSLTSSPMFILLDEPFAGIDPIVVSQLQLLIDQMRQRGIGILITDHNVRETLEITDRTYIINKGEIILSGTAKEIAESPMVREIYLGEKFSLSSEKFDNNGN